MRDIDEIYDITDPTQQQDWFFSGIPVRRSADRASTAAGVSPTMINGRRAWIRKLLGENDGDYDSSDHRT